MPLASKTVSGARAILIVDGARVGIFNNVSYGLVYDAQPVFILGRFSPAEIAYTAQEPVQVTATGWREVDHGPHVSAKLGGAEVPRLQDLLTATDIQLALFDRATNKKIMNVVGVRPTGYSSSVSNRALQEITVTFVGLRLSDESATAAETPGAMDLP